MVLVQAWLFRITHKKNILQTKNSENNYKHHEYVLYIYLLLWYSIIDDINNFVPAFHTRHLYFYFIVDI